MSNGNNFRVFLMQDENIKFRIIGYLFNKNLKHQNIQSYMNI